MIADDEELARETLCAFSARVGELEVVGLATTGSEAFRLVAAEEPHLLFLDVKMPGESGIDALRRMRSLESRPWVVFTSAFDEFVLTAFDLRAVDYLLKPFSIDRFAEAVDRVRGLVEGSVQLRRLGPVVFGDRDLDRLFVRQGRRLRPIPFRTISRLEADRGAVTLHAECGSFVVFASLASLDRRLGERFVRIHRSVLVNLLAIELIEPHDRRRLAVVLTDGSRRVASRSGSKLLRRLGV